VLEPSIPERDEVRARILAAAAALIADGGRDALTTRAVSAAAGVQAPTIYRLFGDKSGLLDAVAELGFAAYLRS
jgi:AcrR family transcriptional regulator